MRIYLAYAPHIQCIRQIVATNARSWMQVGLTMLKDGSTISANAQSLYRVALAKNIRLRSQPSPNCLSYYITYLLALK